MMWCLCWLPYKDSWLDELPNPMAEWWPKEPLSNGTSWRLRWPPLASEAVVQWCTIMCSVSRLSMPGSILMKSSCGKDNFSESNLLTFANSNAAAFVADAAVRLLGLLHSVMTSNGLRGPLDLIPITFSAANVFFPHFGLRSDPTVVCYVCKCQKIPIFGLELCRFSSSSHKRSLFHMHLFFLVWSSHKSQILLLNK